MLFKVFLAGSERMRFVRLPPENPAEPGGAGSASITPKDRGCCAGPNFTPAPTNRGPLRWPFPLRLCEAQFVKEIPPPALAHPSPCGGGTRALPQPDSVSAMPLAVAVRFRFWNCIAASATGLVVFAVPLPALPGKNLPGDCAVRFDEVRRTVTRVEGKNLLTGLQEAAIIGPRGHGAVAIAFVSAYRELFRLADPGHELRVAEEKLDELGSHHVRLAQHYADLEVAGGEMLLHFDRDAALYLVTANYIPTPALTDLQPKIEAAAAVRAAAALLSMTPSNWPAALKIWPSPAGAGILAYEVVAPLARIFVDARSGKILERIPTIYTSKPTSSPRPSQP